MKASCWAVSPLLLAAALLGVLHALAMQPRGWWIAAWLSECGLLALWLSGRQTFGLAMLIGLVYGFSLDCVTTDWLAGAMSRHPDAPRWTLVGGTLFAWVYDALPWALAGGAQALCSRLGPGWRMLAAVPLGATIGWWLNTWVFGGLPWVAPGYAHLDTVLAGYFPVGGYLLVSISALLISGCTVLAFRGDCRWAFAVVGLSGLGWTLQHVPWTKAAGAPVVVGIVQTGAPLDFRPAAWLANATHEMNLRISKALVKRHHVDVVIWPEAALYGSAHAWREALQRGLMPETAGADFVLGMITADPESAIPEMLTDGSPNIESPQTARYNIALAGGPNSSGMHVKHHLLPFGEYWPQSGPLSWLRSEFGPARVWITPGPERPTPLYIRGQRVGATICFEDAFAAAFSDIEAPPSWLINLSNDAWFDGSMPYQHLALSRARALELGRYMVRVANIGPSAIIAPNGHIIAQTAVGKIEMQNGVVIPQEGLTPFGRWGNGLVLALCTALTLALVGAIAQDLRRTH